MTYFYYYFRRRYVLVPLRSCQKAREALIKLDALDLSTKFLTCEDQQELDDNGAASSKDDQDYSDLIGLPIKTIDYDTFNTILCSLEKQLADISIKCISKNDERKKKRPLSPKQELFQKIKQVSKQTRKKSNANYFFFIFIIMSANHDSNLQNC